MKLKGYILASSMAIVLIIIAVFIACIDEYTAEAIQGEKRVVVDAVITDEDELQEITLSYSSQLNAPEFFPIKNAEVTVVDLSGHVFQFSENYNKRGSYVGTIPAEYLQPGNAFQLKFKLLNEDYIYESDFETMTACPEIDSLYYVIDNDRYIGNSFIPVHGIQFFVDLLANSKYSKYFKWELEEIFEYRSSWPIETYWEGEFKTFAPNYKYYYCYATVTIPTIYSVSTADLNENVYLKYPLRFVSTQTQRLYYRYNLKVDQLSISEKAYRFWEQLKKNNQTAGGLSDMQPQQVIGNVHCVNEPDEKVLGFFGVSQIKTTRINIVRDDLRELIYEDNLNCVQWQPERLDFITNSPEESWPIYMAPPPEDQRGLWYAPQDCFDCRMKGGVTELPDIWKN